MQWLPMRAVVLALGTALLWAQDAVLPPEVLLLARVKTKALANIDRLPDFVCTQTMERFSRKGNARDYTREDRVTFDLAFIGGKELYAWPGSDSFQKETPSDLVGYGMSNTGPFGLHLLGIFNYATVIRYAGEEQIEGRRAARYDYRAPAFASPIRLSVGGGSGEAGRRGSFWADPDTRDILRIEVQAEDIPPTVNLASATDRIDYALVDLGGREALLPSRADMEMSDVIGNVSRNISVFTSCRQYTAASSISFSEPAKTDAPPGIETRPLPPDLPVTLALETEIDAARAGVGTPIRAIVSRRSGPVPKGAQVTGRVARILRRPQPVNELAVTIEFTAIEYGRFRSPFRARLDSIGPNNVRARRTQNIHDLMTFVDPPGSGTIFLPHGAGLPRGLLTVWRTEK
jgi:hypothetical protein